MASNSFGVDIDLIKQNALAEGIALREIAIIYAGLTSQEKNLMQQQHLVKSDNGNTVLATFTDSGVALFPEKITGVHYLAA